MAGNLRDLLCVEVKSIPPHEPGKGSPQKEKNIYLVPLWCPSKPTPTGSQNSKTSRPPDPNALPKASDTLIHTAIDLNLGPISRAEGAIPQMLSKGPILRAARPARQGSTLGARRLSEDHKPGRPDEQRRIESCGGVVDMQARILGSPRVRSGRLLSTSHRLSWEATLVGGFLWGQPKGQPKSIWGVSPNQEGHTHGTRDSLWDDGPKLRGLEGRVFSLLGSDLSNKMTRPVERTWVFCGL